MSKEIFPILGIQFFWIRLSKGLAYRLTVILTIIQPLSVPQLGIARLRTIVQEVLPAAPELPLLQVGEYGSGRGPYPGCLSHPME